MYILVGCPWLTLDYTENAIKNSMNSVKGLNPGVISKVGLGKNSTVELPLPTDDIMDLLNLCLTSTYF